jgi:TonB-linked SusC/RagA family outer membrane protein
VSILYSYQKQEFLQPTIINFKTTAHMRKLLFLPLAMLLLYGQLLAQTRTITGQIVDGQGIGVPNASITVKGSTAGTTTKADGRFSLSIPENARVLVISSVGFQQKEMEIKNQSTINVSLTNAENALTEIVVTGYTRERKSQFAGAATVIGGSAVGNVPVGSFDQALQGRAPGLLVNSSSGQPGSSPAITIRGVQSIQGAGAQPLFILDGIPLPANDMQTLNPNDFESITVLKDANAAALYGARGGTGVIVITTKKGRSGVTNFTVRSQMGVTMAPDFSRLNMMNTSEILQYEEMLGLAGAPTNTPGWIYSKKNPSYALQTPAEQARRTGLLDSIGAINTNWRDVLYRQGVSQTHEVNMNGGSDKTRFFISAGFFKQQGIDLGSDLKRYTTRVNIEHTANKVTVQFNTTAGYSTTNFSEGEWLGNSARNPFQMTYRAKPYENPFRQDGSIIFGSNTSLALKQVGNLLEGIENSNWRQNQIKAHSGLTVSYKIAPTVTLRNTSGIDVSSDVWQRFITPNSYIGSLQSFQSGVNSEAYKITSQLINTSSAIFSKKLNDIHEIEVGGYFEVVRGYQKALGFTLYNLDPRLDRTGQGTGTLPVSSGQTTYPQNASSAKTGFGIRSYFATGKYTYDDRYTINANIRRDGTSRIVNVDNREVTTWSAGFIWNALKEKFLQNQNILSDLRVRATYGIIPNIGSIGTGSYGITGGIIGVTNYQGPQVPSFGTSNYAGSSITGLVPTSPGNPDLKIERIQKTNIGVDFSVWNNRARFTVDAYKNKTIDLFVRQPLSGTTGFASLDINAGIMTNKGIEVMASVDVVRQRDLNVTLGFNHAINKNEIEDLGLVNEYFLGTFVIREGLPYGTHYTYHYLGADPATGRPRFETEDGKETLDPAEAGQFAKFGTYLPKHVGGFSAEVRYKRFSVDALFSYQFDVVRSNNTRNWITRGTPGYHASVNASRELLTNQWMKPGDEAFFQAPIYDRGFTSSDLEDARFLRFRNLNLAYQIPEIKAGKTTLIKSARFYVQAQNIAIWSPWRGVDPEDGNNISLNEYPNPRMIVTGIDINF